MSRGLHDRLCHAFLVDIYCSLGRHVILIIVWPVQEYMRDRRRIVIIIIIIIVILIIVQLFNSVLILDSFCTTDEDPDL